MNRKKKEKSMLRKEGNVYVLDLFVRVPHIVTAPVTCTPMEVDAINQVADGREQRKTRSTATAQLCDGRRSERGRQVQANWSRKTAIGVENNVNVTVC